MSGIVKSFVGVRANDNVCFNLRRGEVHTLLGENGAGKSTLMNILAGLYLPESGTIEIDGRKCSFSSPKDAIRHGVGMVHQHFMLVPVQTVWENVALGMDHFSVVLPKRKIISDIMSLSLRYGLEVDPEARVWQLSIGEQQRVAILKMLYREARILILDEPTAVLTPQETGSLFKTVRQMTDDGRGIVFISHKLDEVLEISSRITILRRGSNVGTISAENASKERLAEMMIGRQLMRTPDKTLQNPGDALMEARSLCVRGDRGRLMVNSFSLVMREKEILGIAGVSGNGQQELCESLAGLRTPESGSVIVGGTDYAGRDARAFLDAGVRYIPADRKGVGLASGMNIRENIALRKFWSREFCKWRYFLNWEHIAGYSGRLVERFNVVTPGLGYPVSMLSGGNLQKLMLARELADHPRAIIAVQPTWGLDIGATQFVREALIEQRDRGAGVLLVSDDLDEILAVSDRIAVIYQGRLMGLIEKPDRVTGEQLGLMMAGTSLPEYDPEYSIKPEDERHGGATGS